MDQGAAEAHHRIANSLALLASLVRMEGRAAIRAGHSLTPADMRGVLDSIATRLMAVARQHRFLSQVPPDGSTPLRPYLRAICDDMIAAFSSTEQQLRIVHTGGDCEVSVRHVHDLALIVCEIFINALKHARPHGAPLELQLDCIPDDKGRTLLSIRDNGAGLPDGFDPFHQGGLGFQVIRSLTTDIGATLEIVTGATGLEFRLWLPRTQPL